MEEREEGGKEGRAKVRLVLCLFKLGIVAHTCNPNTQRREAKAGGLLRDLGHFVLYSELRGKLRYITKARLKHRLYLSYPTLLEPMYTEKQAGRSLNLQDA